MFSATCFATEGDPIKVIDNLSDLMFCFIRAASTLMLGFSLVQLGFAIKSRDHSQTANSIMTLVGGLLIIFSKEILGLIMG